MKYCDDQGEVQTLVADRQPFKGLENYFTDAMLYKPAHEVFNNNCKRPQELEDSGNEADTEYESPKEDNEGDYEIISSENF